MTHGSHVWGHAALADVRLSSTEMDGIIAGIAVAQKRNAHFYLYAKWHSAVIAAVVKNVCLVM